MIQLHLRHYILITTVYLNINATNIRTAIVINACMVRKLRGL